MTILKNNTCLPSKFITCAKRRCSLSLSKERSHLLALMKQSFAREDGMCNVLSEKHFLTCDKTFRYFYIQANHCLKWLVFIEAKKYVTNIVKSA